MVYHSVDRAMTVECDPEGRFFSWYVLDLNVLFGQDNTGIFSDGMPNFWDPFVGFLRIVLRHRLSGGLQVLRKYLAQSCFSLLGFATFHLAMVLEATRLRLDLPPPLFYSDYRYFSPVWIPPPSVLLRG